MRILFVNENRGFFGGVEQSIADSSRGLNRRGHSCHLAYRRVTEHGLENFDSNFETVHACAELGAEPAADRVGMSEVVRRVQPDVVFVHKIESIDSLRDLGPVPVVRMVHDHDLVCPRRHKYDAYRGRTCQRAAGWGCLVDLAFVERAPGTLTGMSFVNVAERLRELARHRSGLRLLVASTYMKKELVRNGCAPRNVMVLAPCRDVRAGASRPSGDLRLLYVGQLIRGKGVDLLLRALGTLGPAYRLDVVGSGNSRHDLEDLARRLGVAHRVTFHGWVDSEGIASHFDRCRIAVVPSRWPEPFGMVGVEAMAHGRAVVAFDVGGIGDWLEHGSNGLLVPEQDVARFASAIDDVCRPGRAETMGAAGRRRFEKSYRFADLVRGLETELVRATHSCTTGRSLDEDRDIRFAV